MISEWKNVVQLAAIDCAHDNHTSICRDYEVIAYPTVKFFASHSQPPSLGTELSIASQSEREITRDLVGILQKEQMEGRGSDWPNIIPYRSYDTANLQKGTDNIQYVFLIFADGNDSLATEVILDLSNVKDIEIRSVVPENEIFAKLLGVRSYPSLLVIQKSKNDPEFLRPKDNTRESFRMTIKNFLKSKGFSTPEEPRTVKILAPNAMPSMPELQKARNALVQLAKIKELGDVVFLVDLENTIRYSLEHEIPLMKQISGESLVALNAFLGVLTKYFPMGESAAEFMQKLRDIVFHENEISGETFKTYLNNLSRGGLKSVFQTKDQWMGCRGSESHFRRYPCGVWTLFHYMTVNALQDAHQSHFDPLEVLEAMLGYITHFFGCTDCSKHFRQMVHDKLMRTKVTTAEEAVLWLWSAHNEVNKRLANDKSEDPEFPKIQFPSSERCLDCRHPNGDWNKENVLIYLISVYSQKNLNQMNSNVNLYFANKSSIEQNNHRNSKLFDDENPKKISKHFNVFDISLCVVLYIVSAVICVGLYLKFVLKRRHKRKSYIQDLLGRV